MELSDAVLYGGLTLLLLAITLPILLFVRVMFRRHDPARAMAATSVVAGRPFELPVAIEGPAELFFRFEIDGDTDNRYDLAVRVEIEASDGTRRAAGARTDERTRIDGAADLAWRGETFAVTMSTGSVSLGDLRRDDRVVRGSVSEHPAGLLRRGWVYVPKADA